MPGQKIEIEIEIGIEIVNRRRERLPQRLDCGEKREVGIIGVKTMAFD